MNLQDKLIHFYYQEACNHKEEDLKFYLYWNAFLNLCDKNKQETDGLRASIRRFIEENNETIDRDLDYEDSRLDVFYERPVFEDLKVEEKDLYYYQDFNTNRQIRPNDDYVYSIKNFQKILQDSDLIAFYMSLFKIYQYLQIHQFEEYDPYLKRLIEGSNYLLETAFNNLLQDHSEG